MSFLSKSQKPASSKLSAWGNHDEEIENDQKDFPSGLDLSGFERGGNTSGASTVQRAAATSLGPKKASGGLKITTSTIDHRKLDEDGNPTITKEVEDLGDLHELFKNAKLYELGVSKIPNIESIQITETITPFVNQFGHTSDNSLGYSKVTNMHVESPVDEYALSGETIQKDFEYYSESSGEIELVNAGPVGGAGALELLGGGPVLLVRGAAQRVRMGKYTFTKTVAKNIKSRPYIESPSTIANIMETGSAVSDPFFKGGLNYKVMGEFNGSEGVFELGINPETNTIYHFLFKSSN